MIFGFKENKCKDEIYSKDEINTIANNLEAEIDSRIFSNHEGAVVITSENTNPSNKLGGLWELIGKDYSWWWKNLAGTELFKPGEITMNTLGLTRSGQEIMLNVSFTANDDITRDDINNNVSSIGLLYLEEIGISELPYAQRVVGFSPSSNAFFMLNINNIGNMEIVGVSTSAGIKAGSECYFSVNIKVPHSRMLDKDCDKFYWKRLPDSSSGTIEGDTYA